MQLTSAEADPTPDKQKRSALWLSRERVAQAIACIDGVPSISADYRTSRAGRPCHIGSPQLPRQAARPTDLHFRNWTNAITSVNCTLSFLTDLRRQNILRQKEETC